MFPAPAGMTLDFIIDQFDDVYVPRACGDDPGKSVLTDVTMQCSPRLRG